MITAETKVQKSTGIVTRNIGLETVLIPVNVFPQKNVYSFNSTGTFVWNSLDGLNSIATIVDLIVKNNSVKDKSKIEKDIVEFITDLHNEKLITISLSDD